MDESIRTCNKRFAEIIMINHKIPRGTAGHFIKVVFEMRRFIIE
jgi:hypothetical protein